MVENAQDQAHIEDVNAALERENRRLREEVAALRQRLQGTAPMSFGEELYRLLVERQSEGLGLVDEDERFVFANPAGHDIFGVGPGELIGRLLMDFLPEASREIVLEQTRRRRKGEPSAYEIDIVRADGGRRTLFVSGSPYLQPDSGFIGTFAVFRDVTDARTARERLRGMAELLDAAPSSIVVHDHHGRVLYGNKKSAELHGESPESFRDSNLFACLAPGHEATLRSGLQRALTEGAASFELETLAPCGNHVPLAVWSRTVVWDGQEAILSHNPRPKPAWGLLVVNYCGVRVDWAASS